MSISNLIKPVKFNSKLVPLIVLLIFSLTTCGTIEKHSIKASLDVKVTDPNLRTLTEITESASVKAKGKFKPGTFFVNAAPVMIPPETTFQIDLTAPLDNPDVISTQNAIGTLKTSKQISIGTIPVPLELKLQSGKVKAYVDFAKSLSAFLINIVQLGGKTGGMKDMIESLELEEVNLKLRPDSNFKLGKKNLHIGKDSTITLFQAKIDEDLNYHGQFIVKANFLPNCNWLGEKLDCQFEGGSAWLQLDAEKKHGKLTLKLPKENSTRRQIKLTDCLLKFGKNKRSTTLSKTCEIELKDFQWQDTETTHPTMSMDSDFDLFDTDAKIKTDIHQTVAHFPGEVPGMLKVKIGKADDRFTHFATTGTATAKEGTVTIEKTNSKVVLQLTNVTIGKVVYDKTGAMEFTLNNGTANVTEIGWLGQGNHLVLQCGGGSTLKVPNEFLIEKPTKTSSAKVQMPIELSLGKANLKSGHNSIALEDFKGHLVLDVHKEVLIRGNMDFSLPELDLFSGYKARVKARGLDMSVIDGKSKIYLRDCSLIVPDKTLEATLQERVPKTFHFTLNKKIQETKKWRYRNAMLKEVSIDNFSIKKMSTLESDVVRFTASGDANTNGTIEKTGIVFNKSDWETKPWSMKGHLEGNGEVRYKFLKRNKTKKARLKYDLSMKVTMPDKVDLDWSKVSGGLIKVAEKSHIVGQIKSITLPIEHSDEVTLFKQDAPIWKNFAVSNLKVKDLPDATQINFELETKM